MKIQTGKDVQRLATDTGFKELPSDWIGETLSLYRPNYRTLLSVSTKGYTTRAMFSCFDYPFTEPGHINYVTASLAMLLVSQLGYVHVRSGIERQVTKEMSGLGTEDFFTARDQGNIIFSDISIHFKKRIPVEYPFVGIVTHSNVRRLPTAVVSRFSFDFDHHAAYGDGTCFLILR